MTPRDRESEEIEEALALVGRRPPPSNAPPGADSPDRGHGRGGGKHGVGPGASVSGPDRAGSPDPGTGQDDGDGSDSGRGTGRTGGADGGDALDLGRAVDQQHGAGPGTSAPGAGRGGSPEPGREAEGHGSRHTVGAGMPATGVAGRGAATGAHAAGGRHHARAWGEARAIAERAGRGAGSDPAPRAESVPLDRALGRALAEALTALTDLPSFDTSAMDGWAVSGPGPWTIRSAPGDSSDAGDGAADSARGTAGDSGILAGQAVAAPLPDGSAVRIATGARIPPDVTAVIRSEHARTDSGGRLHAEREVAPGQDIRPRGQECRSGDRLLPAGSLVTPAVLGLAAAAGYDELLTVPQPRVEVLVLGDELLTEGLPHDGLIRDALGPMLGPWLRGLGAEVLATRRIGDDADALHRAITGSEADLVITTGGTAAGPVDHVHPVLRKAGAELLVDGVAVRPGHPMLLARLAPGQHLVGLPGNPLAAVSGLLTLAEPLLRALAGRSPRVAYRVPLREAVHGHPYDTRLVPVVHRDEGLVPLHFNGPAMLRGIAAADGLAVVPPSGARAGEELEVLDLPWTASADGPLEGVSRETGCFT
ncbi:molybdopterin molybdotransferase MoeA [Streptomyces sp. GMY02]|uniref:molybdopterin molybdotransferase MoeA n=1 Tax=Streptomyces sp. GMY02 TaxID=1333528 RepID=UPI001C2C8E0F|nr:molybdopterin molybdotransferase MoeA [Streptomyces sp. GMY02]QXE35748.1 molybdopterin molybdotransferase MoeA [Streptomyces sp. GMY02]